MLERVIFRTEYDDNMEKYLAIFPDDSAFPGRIAYIPFYFTEHNTVFECYGEMDLDYYYSKTKSIKDNKIVKRLLNTLENYCGMEFRVVKKMIKNRFNRRLI